MGTWKTRSEWIKSFQMKGTCKQYSDVRLLHSKITLRVFLYFWYFYNLKYTFHNHQIPYINKEQESSQSNNKTYFCHILFLPHFVIDQI